MGASHFMSSEELRGLIGRAAAPRIVDVRKAAAFDTDPRMIAGAVRRLPDAVAAWRPGLMAGLKAGLKPHGAVVVYCAHGQEVSQGVAAALRDAGIDARYLEGGIDGWRTAGGPTMRKPAEVLGEISDSEQPVRDAPTCWVTRARPKIDRIACPWLLRRFVDPDSEIRFVAAERVLAEAKACGGVPFDVPDVAFSHDGPLCSFDAFLRRFGLDDPALDSLALIVRAADTGRLDLAPQAAGLLAVSLGLSALYPDDGEMLAHGLLVYDALYAWCRDAANETHGWPPAAWVSVM
jgi:rhodanese-related sulfurtransferase